MTNPQLQEAQANAQRTYDRRRARNFAEGLANIPPNRWDDATRAIIITLATLAIPSRIDGPLVEAFEPPIGALNDGYVAADEGPDDPDIRQAMAGELRRMGLMDPEPAARVYPPAGEQQRPRPEPHPRPERVIAVGHHGPCRPGCVHDNGDYRA